MTSHCTQIGFDLASVYPASSPFSPKENSSTNNSSPKIPCHSLVFTRTRAHSSVSSSFCLDAFFSAFHAPHLPLSTFAPSLSLPSYFPVITLLHALPACHLCVRSPSRSPDVCCRGCFPLLLPPQASSAAEMARSLQLLCFWCSMHF